MKTNVVPLLLTEMNEREQKEMKEQLVKLEAIYGGEANFLPPQPVGRDLPREADAVIFPLLTGAVFAHQADLERLSLPVMILTSEFGTVEMWDWEIAAYLRETLGMTIFTPYNTEMGKTILRSIRAKKEMRGGRKFLMFQDSPGEGMQAYIFKRFYWWEPECGKRIEEAFGVKIVYDSWKELNERARRIPDETAIALWREREVPCRDLPMGKILKAVKLYAAIRERVREIGGVCGVGANCLNESFHSDTTPCLAWDWLFTYDHLIWACEGDLVTLISKYILHSALQKPLMMTNIYPFLVGMAALKHEKIMEFPKIEDPDNHALGVHCGYFGFVPRSFCTEWVMRPKVLEIVNDDAVVIDCRMKTGPVTMAKLHPDMKKLTIIEAEIEDYVQYPGSDCRNGALIRYSNRNGHKVMESLSSHHAILIEGADTPLLLQMARVYGFEAEVI